MEIVVDDREHVIVPYLADMSDKYHISYKIQRNQVGDYAIVYKGFILLIIERKTWIDLAASMRDGRKENIEKLKNVRSSTKCQLGYLIEGNATPNFDRRYGRLPVKNLKAHLDHLAFRDQIHMFYSKDPVYTAERLFELAGNLLTMKEIIKDLDEKCPTVQEVQKPKQILMRGKKVAEEITSPTNEIETNVCKLQEKQECKVSLNEQLLRCIPSVGSIISAILAENSVTVYKLFTEQYCLDDIAKLKYTSGAMIGAAAAGKILAVKKLIQSESKLAKTFATRLLTCISGVTAKTAQIIIETYSLFDIFSGEVSVDMLADIKKTEKTRIGIKVSEEILNRLLDLEQNRSKPTKIVYDSDDDLDVGAIL